MGTEHKHNQEVCGWDPMGGSDCNGNCVVKIQHPVGKGWIGVDFDKTLAKYESWEKNAHTLGHPILPMVERVKRWLARGIEVRVFTARAAHNSLRRELDIELIKQWCRVHIGQELEVTAEKDFNMIELWDDRAVRVDDNLGTACSPASHDPLDYHEELELWREQRRVEKRVSE